MKMVTDKLYCVDLLAKRQDYWLTCDTIYSPNSAVKDGTHILHNLFTFKFSVSYFISSKAVQMFHQIKIGFSRLFSRLVYLWFKYVVKIFCWSEKLTFV